MDNRELRKKKLERILKWFIHETKSQGMRLRRILLTGKNGQIGWELQRTLATLGEVVAVDRNDMDLTNPDAIRKVIRETKPR